MKATDPKFRAAAAFSLVEVALALGISAFCLVPLVALVPLGFNSNQAASSQTTAASIITHVLADLRATPAGSAATSAQYNIAIPAPGSIPYTQVRYFGNGLQQFYVPPPGPSPTPSPTPSSTSRYRLTATFFPPPTSGRAATGVMLQVTWPATVDPVAAPNSLAGRVQVFSALNRN